MGGGLNNEQGGSPILDEVVSTASGGREPPDTFIHGVRISGGSRPPLAKLLPRNNHGSGFSPEAVFEGLWLVVRQDGVAGRLARPGVLLHVP